VKINYFGFIDTNLFTSETTSQINLKPEPGLPGPKNKKAKFDY
jgi:hypothetical protein